jgi:hypothetical protein
LLIIYIEDRPYNNGTADCLNTPSILEHIPPRSL